MVRLLSLGDEFPSQKYLRNTLESRAVLKARISKYFDRIGLVAIVVFAVGCGDSLKSEPSNTAIPGQ